MNSKLLTSAGHFQVLAILSILSSPSMAQVQLGDERDVQIRSVDFADGIVEVFNFGQIGMNLAGWRFCTHDGNQQRIYTAPDGLNGVVIQPSASVFIHFNNDAPAGDSSRINRATLGTFALPLAPSAYGMQLFFPDANGTVNFGNSSLIADHLMWNDPSQAVGLSQFRCSQAAGQGLWTNCSQLIESTALTRRIELTDVGDGRLHGPANYQAFEIVLDATALVRGTRAGAEVTGAMPGESVVFLRSQAGTGAGPCPAVLGFLCLDLLNPIRIVGSATADASGRAVLVSTVPPAVPLVPVFLQAVIGRGAAGVNSVKTNFLTRVVQP